MKPLLLVVLATIGFLHAAEKPNVLFIAIDDLNDWLGCYETHPGTKTPNIDRLAQRGVVFTNAHCQTALCGPSRASMITGLLPTTTGIYNQLSNQELAKLGGGKGDMRYLPQWFADNGYHTMGTGKITHNGFPKNAFEESGKYRGFGPKPKERFVWKNEGTQTDWGAFPESDEMMPDYMAATWAVNRLKRDQEKPFFLAVGFVRPHVPFYVPQKWFDLHPLDSITLPPYKPDDLKDIPEISRYAHEVPPMPTTEWVIKHNEWKKAVQGYLACISFVDAQVGRVLDTLEKSPHADNTVIVLWSDHGYHLGEKGRFSKHGLWREATRVPLIFAGPGISKGQRRNQPVGLIDLYPTLLDLCGLPEKPSNDGRSLKPLLGTANPVWPHPAISTWGFGNFAVSNETHAYLRWEDSSEELYDIVTDENEFENLAHSETTLPLRKKLATAIPKNPSPWESPRVSANEYFRTTPSQGPAKEKPK